MSAYKILILCSAIAFGIGALVPVIGTGGTPRSINWLCAGFCLAAVACFIHAPN